MIHNEKVELFLSEEEESFLKEEEFSPTTKPFVVQELEKKAEIYKERNALYGDNYKRFGPILTLVLAGQSLDTSDPNMMNRLGIFVQIVAKVTRYGNMFTRGGHEDSLDDISVYAMMLKELDNDGQP